MTEHVPQYGSEAVDRLPFSTPEKSQRYQTENYAGAVGLNWYRTDPTLQFTMAYYFQPDELAVVEPQLTGIGELMGGPVARWAEETDRNPPRLERYDRWGHDISRVVMPASFTQAKRAVLDAQQELRSGGSWRGLSFVAGDVRVELSAQPGRYRHGLRAGNRRRHGPVVGGCLRAPRCARPCAGQVRFRRVGRGNGAATDRTHGRVGSGRAGNHRISQRRRLAAERLQVVRLELRRGSIRRARQARGRARHQPRRRQLPGVAHPPRRLAQRGAGPPAEGQTRNPLGRLRRGRVRRRRGLSAVRDPPRIWPVRRQGPGRNDGADQRGTTGDRVVRAGQRASRPGRVAVLRPAAAGVRRRPDRQAADASQAGRADRRRRSRAGAGVRRHRSGQPPATPKHPAAHRGPGHQAQGRPARHHRGVGRHRDSRRQRLHRNLAGGKAFARWPGQHHLGGPRQHPVPGCAAWDRADARARGTVGAAA